VTAFEVYVDNVRRVSCESLEAAKHSAKPLIAEGGEICIRHLCSPAPTAVWVYSRMLSDWVRSD
jgi:hypothetical protein